MDKITQKNNLEVFKNELKHSIEEATNLLNRVEWMGNLQQQLEGNEHTSDISKLLREKLNYDIAISYEEVGIIRFIDKHENCIFKKING